MTKFYYVGKNDLNPKGQTIVKYGARLQIVTIHIMILASLG